VNSSYVQARDEIVTMLHADLVINKPGLPVFWENTLQVDLNVVADPFVRIEIDFDDAEQLTINNDPWHRVHGSIYVTVFTKEGGGTRHALELFDYFSNLAKFRLGTKFSSSTPRPGRKTAKQGWVSFELGVPFHFDVTV
jgi:hypothetical protein